MQRSKISNSMCSSSSSNNSNNIQSTVVPSLIGASNSSALPTTPTDPTDTTANSTTVNAHTAYAFPQPSSLTTSATILPDSGANGIFVRDDSSAHNFVHTVTRNAPHDAVQLTLPNGARIHSSATATLRGPPGLPPLRAHLFPGLTSQPLLGLSPLCDKDLTVAFSRNSVTVTNDHDRAVVWSGPRDPTTGMWQLPLNPTLNDTSIQAVLAANNVVRHTSNAQRVAFYHACFGSPALSTFTKALDHDLLLPGIDAQMVRRNPPTTIATAFGHLDQSRQGTGSMSRKHAPRRVAATVLPAAATTSDDDDDQLEPSIIPAEKIVYVTVLELSGKHASDTTGRFPMPSYTGNEYILLFVDEDANYLHPEPVKSRSAEHRLAAYKKGVDFFRSKGCLYKYEYIDNEISKNLTSFFESTGIDYQLTPASTHRRNKAERAIRTFKNHFISILATCDPDFPMAAWDELLPHAELTLNLMRRSRTAPNLSAWAHVNGPYDYRRTPIGPPGCKVVILEPAHLRPSWAPHGVIAFHTAPCLHHYRTYRVFVPATQAPRSADSLSWHPRNVTLPGASPMEQLTAAIDALQAALSDLALRPRELHHLHQPLSALQPTLADALSDLAAIFHTAAPDTSHVPDTLTHPAVQRVSQPDHPTHPVVQRVPLAPDQTITRNDTLAAPAGGNNLTHRDLFPASRPRHGRRPRGAKQHEAAAPVISAITSAPATAPSSLASTGVSPAPQLIVPVIALVPTTVSPPLPAAALSAPPAPRRSSRAPVPSQRHAHSAITHHPVDRYLAEMAAGIARTQQRDEDAHILRAHSSTLHPAYQPGVDCPFIALKATFSPEGEELRHDKLMKGPSAAVWDDETVDDYDRLIERTHTMCFIPRSEKPPDRTASNFVLACYEKFKCGVRKRRVRGTHGGHTDYQGDLAAYTASATTVKILLNSVVSTPSAKFATADISDFYLNTPLDRPEYVKIRRNQIPLRTWAKYNLDTLVFDDNYVMARLDKTIPGLPQSGILSQTALVKHLHSYGYRLNEGCLLTHTTRPIAAALIVDDFGIKYTDQADLDHLLQALRDKYDITFDSSGTHYIGIDLAWTYTMTALAAASTSPCPTTWPNCSQPSVSPNPLTPPTTPRPTQRPPTPENSTRPRSTAPRCSPQIAPSASKASSAPLAIMPRYSTTPC